MSATTIRKSLKNPPHRCHFNRKGKSKQVFISMEEANEYIKKHKMVGEQPYVCTYCNQIHIGKIKETYMKENEVNALKAGNRALAHKNKCLTNELQTLKHDTTKFMTAVREQIISSNISPSPLVHKVKIKKLSPACIIPAKQTPGAAAYDVYIPEDTVIIRGRQIVPLGFAIELPVGYEAHIQSRSGYAAKGIETSTFFVKNNDGFLQAYTGGTCIRVDCDVLEGKIDADYRGNVGVILHNHDIPFMLSKGQRIAQMTIRKVETIDFIEVEELSDTSRGQGGFGSTNNQK